MTMTGEDCPGCAAMVGEQHAAGCVVARCKTCGFQEQNCEHKTLPMTTWTGRWPGDEEVDEGLADDLAHLYVRRLRGELVWDTAAERWRLAGVWVARVGEVAERKGLR